MNFLKKFLDQRSKNLAQRKVKHNPSITSAPDPDVKEVMTDHEFWEIFKRFHERAIEGKKSVEEIWEELLEPLSKEKIEKFLEMYDKLSK